MQVYYGTQSSWYDTVASGNRTHYVQTYPGATYVSGIFHHVKLTGLMPDTTYFYRQALCPSFHASASCSVWLSSEIRSMLAVAMFA